MEKKTELSLSCLVPKPFFWTVSRNCSNDLKAAPSPHRPSRSMKACNTNTSMWPNRCHPTEVIQWKSPNQSLNWGYPTDNNQLNSESHPTEVMQPMSCNNVTQPTSPNQFHPNVVTKPISPNRCHQTNVTWLVSPNRCQSTDVTQHVSQPMSSYRNHPTEITELMSLHWCPNIGVYPMNTYWWLCGYFLEYGHFHFNTGGNELFTGKKNRNTSLKNLIKYVFSSLWITIFLLV